MHLVVPMNKLWKLVDIMQETHVNQKVYHQNIILFYYIIFTEQSFAKSEYYKCPEKINTVLSGKSEYITAGSIIGVNYVKLSGTSSPFANITIKFKDLEVKILLK